MLEPALIVKRLVNDLLLPPGGPFVVALAGLWIGRWRPRLGKTLAIGSLIVGLFLCTPMGAFTLTHWLEAQAGPALTQPALEEALKGADPPMAIVLLSGGTGFDHRERPQPDTPRGITLQRTLHAVRLARWSDLPILVSGASVYTGRPAEAQTLSRVIRDDFGQPVRWIEDQSIDTLENAARSAQLLRAQRINHVVLVTDSLHMRRSVLALQAQGIRVLPAPMAFSGEQGADISTMWLPSMSGLSLSYRASHEWLGLAWQMLRSVFGRGGPITAVQS